MFRQLRSHVRSNLVGYVALFVALGGTGAYASHLTVDGSDVVDESLTGTDVRGKPRTSTTAAVNGSLTTDDIAGQQAHAPTGTPFIDGTLTQWDVKNGALVGADLANNTVGGGKVTDSSITGADVDEASLGKVPDADKLDGIDSLGFIQGKGTVYVARMGVAPEAADGPETLLSVPGFGNVRIDCEGGGGAVGNVLSFDYVNLSGGEQLVVEDQGDTDPTSLRRPAGLSTVPTPFKQSDRVIYEVGGLTGLPVGTTPTPDFARIVVMGAGGAVGGSLDRCIAEAVAFVSSP